MKLVISIAAASILALLAGAFLLAGAGGLLIMLGGLGVAALFIDLEV